MGRDFECDILTLCFHRRPFLINDGLTQTAFAEQSRKRRQWIMDQCDGPIVLCAPNLGPNQMYPWASCYTPVYQDSYILFLTGINQLGIRIILDPRTNKHCIFLPEYDQNKVFWDGDFFAVNDSKTESFLRSLGFTNIYPLRDFNEIIRSIGEESPNWHLCLHQQKTDTKKDESNALRTKLKRLFGTSFKYTNIANQTWEQRFTHQKPAIECSIVAAEKTNTAFCNALNQAPIESETQLCGTLIGELLKQTPFGLSFSPIIAGNERAAILHYTNNSAPIHPSDLVLMDFGLRWQSMCSDVSRTIPVNGQYTDLQKRLVQLVLNTLEATITMVKEGISFNDLNEFAWDFLEQQLHDDFIKKGGKVNRLYKKQPHNIGHLLGIQVHDGDSSRGYKSKPLKPNSIITIEPGLYGTFEFNGETATYGIRVEDNLLVTKNGCQNLTSKIPKSISDIEALLKR